MQLSAVIDVALGLFFTFFLLALIASGLQEVMAGFFQLRGKCLAKAIDVLLDNDPNAAFSWLGPGNARQAHSTDKPAESAAKPSPEDRVLGPVVRRIKEHPLLHGVPDRLPSYLPAGHFALAVVAALGDGSKSPLFTQVEKTIDDLPEGDLKATLRLFASDAAQDIERFRNHLERWFDAAMDRASGIYKRLSQYTLFILGIALAVALNVDALHLTRTLWEVPATRDLFVAHASAASAIKKAADAWNELHGLPLPLGWGHLTGPGEIGGWIVTGLAVSLGAPFWFDVVQKISSVRAAGPKPDRAAGPEGAAR